MLGKMITLHEASYRAFLDAPNRKTTSRLILLLVGIGYGAISIASNASYITSFDSSFLKNVIVPLIFLLFGILTAYLTKYGLALLLWAGAKGIGGKGLLRQINTVVPVALVPGLLAVPFMTGFTSNVATVLLLIVGVIWMYLISVKAVKAIESFHSIKAYVAVLFAFLFFASIYYLIVPS